MMAVRLNAVLPEYVGQVRLRMRAFPLELGGEPAPRDILEQEWCLAALQEPEAEFAPFRGDDWPATTLPAFHAAWAATQQGEATGHDYDLRIRRAFFAQSRNVGRSEVLLELAQEAGLDVTRFTRDMHSDAARAAALAERQAGRDRYGVRGTPTLMLADGTKLPAPLAEPRLRNRKIVAIGRLPCYGESCRDAVRALYARALALDVREPA
ncbi:MAG: DsbA family oxidoreductase [Chloroflexota bacterium]